MRRRPVRLALALALGLACASCHSSARFANNSYTWTSATFSPNPVASIPYYVGLVSGFVAGLPLCVLSWPLSLVLYPDHGEFMISASLGPSMVTGAFVGTVLGAPFYPFGIPWLPDEHPVPVEEPR